MLAASVTSSALEGRTRTRGTSCWKENDVIPSPKKALSGRSPVFVPAERKEPLTPPRTMMWRAKRWPWATIDSSRTCAPMSMVSRPVPTRPRATCTDSGMGMSVRFSQPLNASSSMTIRPSGSVTRSSLALFSKAPAPIVAVPGATVAALAGVAGANRTRAWDEESV